MGYSHYFYRKVNLDDVAFQGVARDCQKICEILDTPIQYELDNDSPALFDKDAIHFNGIGDDGHETFYLPKVYTRKMPSSLSHLNLPFQFCKTARKPYDINVCCCLIIAKHHLGDDIRVNSDGSLNDWKEAMEKCQEHLGYGAYFYLDEKDD